MNFSTSRPDRSVYRNRWRWFRWPIAIVAFVGIGAWSRGLWWPLPFQSAARNSLFKEENEDALKSLAWATLFAPEDSETAFLRARAYRRLGQFNQSIAAIKRAKQSQPRSERLQREEWLCQARSGQLSRVSQHVPELLRDPRGESEEIYEALIHGCILMRRYVEANQLFQTWMREKSTQARPYVLRAKLWKAKSQLGPALDDLKRAVLLEPDNSEAIVELASVYQRVQDFEQAIPLYERVLASSRFADRAHVGIAICLKSRGETGRIRQLLERAVKIAPENSEAHCELGRLEFETGHYPAAILCLNEALRIAPLDDESHYVLAQTLVANRTPDQSIPHFEFVRKVREGMQELNRCEKLLTKNPRDVEAMVIAGSILLDISDRDDGVPRLLAALEIEPNHPIARKRLAEHFARRAESNPEFAKQAERYRDPP